MTQAECFQTAIVYDIGATKTAVGVVGQEDILHAEQFATPQNDPEQLLHKIGESMVRLSDQFDTKVAAVACNGPTFYENDTCTVGPLYRITPEEFELPRVLGAVVPETRGMGIFGLNDAEAAAYAVVRPCILGRIPTCRETIMYVNQGTGIGGDAIRNGRSTRAGGLLAEYGEMLMHQPDGSIVTWGSLVSGEGIQHRYGADVRTAADLYKDPKTEAVWEKVGQDMARGLGKLLPVIGPRTVVIGGSVSQCSPRYGAALEQRLDGMLHTLSEDSATRRPEILYVPPCELKTIALKGAFAALNARSHEVVTVA